MSHFDNQKHESVGNTLQASLPAIERFDLMEEDFWLKAFFSALGIIHGRFLFLLVSFWLPLGLRSISSSRLTVRIQWRGVLACAVPGGCPVHPDCTVSANRSSLIVDSGGKDA